MSNPERIEIVASVMLAAGELCIDCLAAKTAISRAEAGSLLSTFAKTVTVFQSESTCAGCLDRRTLYSLNA
jgi:hypothetical protein